MVAASIHENVAVAMPAELLWKVAFTMEASSLQKALAGMIDAVDVKGDGGPGSLITLRFNPAAGKAAVLKSRLAARDDSARVISWDQVVVKGGEVTAAAQLKPQVVQVEVVPAGEGACVARFTVEYERLDGMPLSPEDQAKLVKGYVGLVKKAEENVRARPAEFA